MSKPRFASSLVAASAFLLAAFLFRPHSVGAAERAAAPAAMPVPANYREWVYLSSGLDMTYTQAGSAPLPQDHASVFDNVFVNPEAYRVFVQTATWPDNTMFVLENRSGERNVSINKAGRTQGTDVMGLELHAKFGGFMEMLWHMGRIA